MGAFFATAFVGVAAVTRSPSDVSVGLFQISEHSDAQRIDEATPAAASNGENYLIVWKDNRLNPQPYHRGEYLLYGRRFDLSGRALEAGSFSLGADPFVWNSEGVTQPTIAVSGSDYLVVWVTRKRHVSGRLVRNDGTVLTNEIQMGRIGTAAGQPAAASTRRGMLVAWTERVNNNGNIYATLLDSTGKVTGIHPIATNTANSQHPIVASDGRNYLVVWRELAASGEVTANAAVVKQNGEIHHVGKFPSPCARGVALASNGRNFLVGFQSPSAEPDRSDLVGCLLNSRGRIVRDRLPLAMGLPIQSLPSLLSNGRDFTMLVRTHPYLDEAELLASSVSRRGGTDLGCVPILSPAGWRGYGAATSAGSSGALFVLEQKSADYDNNGYISRVRASLLIR